LGSRSDRARLAIFAFLGLFAAVGHTASASAEEPGDIEGTVHIARLKVGSSVSGYGDVVVYLEDAPNTGGLPRGPFQIEQTHKSFVPPLLIVPRGASVAFPNNDEFSHNVFSVTPRNSFDLGLYAVGVGKAVTLEAPGVVSIYCNVHPQMVAHVIVVTNAFYAQPKPDGSFALKGVPPGRYRLAVWFARGQPFSHEVAVEAGRTAALRIDLREVRAPGRHLDKVGLPYVSYSSAGRERRRQGLAKE
jgi:plastocyanin